MKSVDPILRNAGALAASQIIIKALNIVVSVMMVRWLGAQNLGRYSYILAFCYPFGAVADFGLATLAIRDISQDRRRETVVLATLRRLLVTLTTLSSFALLTTAALTRHDAVTFLGIAVVALSSLLSVLTTP
ncbi:MAG: oligosaccharide flippase family protein, partial [Candidatus Methylomirabilota bacterium]